MKDYEKTLAQAEKMHDLARSNEDRSYWSGYITGCIIGLKRAKFGDLVVSDVSHNKSLAYKDSDDAVKQKHYCGYVGGLLATTIPSKKKGRPTKDTVRMNCLWIDAKLAGRLKSKARAEGITVPEARRQAYWAWVGD